MASRTSFTNVRISDSFGQLLIVGDDSGITSSSVQIFDADGTGSPLSLSTTQLTINDGANDFDIASHDGTNGLKLGGTLVTTSAIQTLTDKTLQQPKLKENELASSFTVTFRTDNITEDRVIKFPDADATLLSTENVTLEDVTFGAGLAAANLTGRTRLQQYFYSGFN